MTRHTPTRRSPSPVLRGKLVRTRLLCQSMPPPPANVDTKLKPVAQAQTTRAHFAQHSQDATCSACHQLMDPIGFGFEHYDGFGRWRDQDNGFPVDASGTASTGVKEGSVTFDGVSELSAYLAKSDDVRQCFLGAISRTTPTAGAPRSAAGRVHLRRHQHGGGHGRPARRAPRRHPRAALHEALHGRWSVMFSRRRFNTSVGAGLLLAPFLSQLSSRPARAAGKRAKRVLLFCTMGTSPDLWTPTGVSGESTFTLTPATQPLEAIRPNLVLVDGLVSANPGDNHGSPDARSRASASSTRASRRSSPSISSSVTGSRRAA